MEKLVLIDGNSLINRAFYAMPLLSTKDGVYTNAVYGFMNMFFKMLGEIKPTYCAVAFDVHAPTFRHKMYSEYKGTRKPSPPELHPQIDLLKDTLNLMGVYTEFKAGIEADDIIGTLSKCEGVETVIFTGDKDSFQLVDEKTEVHFTRRGITDVDIYDNGNFFEKTGIYPRQIIDLKALMGDSSDNIKGVAGIGEKTAKDLIAKYQSVENIYLHVDEMTGKLHDKLVDGKESAFFSKTLATIKTDCDIEKDLEKMRVPTTFKKEVRDRFIELEFKSLYTKNELFNIGEETETVKLGETAEEKINVERITVENLDDVKTEKAESIFIGDTVDIYAGGKEYVIKIRQTLLDDGMNLKDVLLFIKPLITGISETVLYDKKSISHLTLDVASYTVGSKCNDLSILKYLVDFSGGKETYKDVMTVYGGDEKLPAYSMYVIFNRLYGELEEQKMKDLYYNVELPLADVLFDMENAGFRIDTVALLALGKKYQEELKDFENKIRELAGEPSLNINSPKQLGDVLFNKLKIGKGKKTQSGYSTSADVLEKFEDSHEIVGLILNYRKIQKIYSTYIEGFLPLIDKSTGIIKTSFNQTVTSTGRLSSKEPNLQNIPVRDDEGKELRKFFVPRDSEHILVGADYSQIELRLLASFSNCKGLIDAFNSGVDVHTDTASKVFNVPTDKVTDSMRRNAKAVNFGVIYGISPYGLAKNLKIEPDEAKRYISSYFNEYKEVRKYMDDNVDFARKNGYATTYLNRRRYIKEIWSENKTLQGFGERAAMNMPLQGSAADVIKLAMLGVHRRLKSENLKSRLILQVHDELIIDTLKSEREKVEKLLLEEMENAVDLKVKLTVSLGSGETWFDAK